MLVSFLVLFFLSFSLGAPGQNVRSSPSASDPYDSNVVCNDIADDYIELIAQHELVEKIHSHDKHRTHEEDYYEFFEDSKDQEGFFEEEARKFMTIQLMKEMRQVRTKILNATLDPFTHATTPPQELNMRLRAAVAHIYHQLRDLKIAQWNQETENEEFDWDINPMKQLGYRLDVSFMALVYRCLLPEVTQDSNVCEIIANEYNDIILDEEIVHSNLQKEWEQPDDYVDHLFHNVHEVQHNDVLRDNDARQFAMKILIKK